MSSSLSGPLKHTFLLGQEGFTTDLLLSVKGPEADTDSEHERE